MNEVLLQIHVWLSQLANLVAEPIYTLALKLDVWGGMKAFLLGLVGGATAPCQLTSNSTAVALITYETEKIKGVECRELYYRQIFSVHIVRHNVCIHR